MRRVVFAPSFDAELLDISWSIEKRFGMRVADDFESRVQSMAETLAAWPEIGTKQHGYPTTLFAAVLTPNWIFYRFTENEVHFLHIRDGRQDKPHQTFSG